MEKKSASQMCVLVDLYLCAPNGKEECLVVLYIVCP